MAPPAGRQIATLTIFEAGRGAQSGKIEFQFNPSDYRITKGANYDRTPNKSTEASTAEFTGATARTMSIRMLLVALNAQGDADASHAQDQGRRRAAVQVCRPDRPVEEQRQPVGAPGPVPMGTGHGIQGGGDDITADYQAFLSDGRPSRVEVTLEMQEVVAPHSRPEPNIRRTGDHAGRAPWWTATRWPPSPSANIAMPTCGGPSPSPMA